MKKEAAENSSKGNKLFRLILIILIVIVLILLIVVVIYFMNKQSFENTKNLDPVILENPMKKIVEEYSEQNVKLNEEEVIQAGIKEFNADYINYLLGALNVNLLHSFVGFGNPIVELILDNEVWSSEISGNVLITKKSPNENKDLRFVISKEEAVRALLSQDIKKFMKDSVINGKTQIEMVSGKSELFSKGYLDLYNTLIS